MEWSDILQKVLVTVIQVLLPVVLGILVAWLKQQWELTKARIPAEQLLFASELARQLVLAAEQNGLTQALSDVGSDKKDWVIQRLESSLEGYGIHLDVKVLSDLIEAAVYESLTELK